MFTGKKSFAFPIQPEGDGALPGEELIMETTVTTNQLSGSPLFVGYNDGVNVLSAYGSIIDQQSDIGTTLYWLSRTNNSTSYIGFTNGSNNGFGIPNTDMFWNRVEVKGITDSSFLLNIDRSVAAAVNQLGSAHPNGYDWRYDSTQWGFVDGHEYRFRAYRTIPLNTTIMTAGVNANGWIGFESNPGFTSFGSMTNPTMDNGYTITRLADLISVNRCDLGLDGVSVPDSNATFWAIMISGITDPTYHRIFRRTRRSFIVPSSFGDSYWIWNRNRLATLGFVNGHQYKVTLYDNLTGF